MGQAGESGQTGLPQGEGRCIRGVEKGQWFRYWTRNRRDVSTGTLSYVKEGSQALSRYEYKQGNSEPLAKPRLPLSPHLGQL